MGYSTNKRIALLDAQRGLDVEAFDGYPDAFEACARRALSMLQVEDARRVMDDLRRRLERVCEDRRRDDERDAEEEKS